MKLKLVVVIADKNKTEKVINALCECGAAYPHAALGTGTAPTALSEVLGIGQTEKGVVFCTAEEEKVSAIFDCLKEKFWFGSKGAGVAFTLPVGSVGGPATLNILTNGAKERKI